MSNRSKPKHPDCRTDIRKSKTISVLERRQPTLTVVLENVDDPHNLSAVLRSCDAVGILEVYIINYTEKKIKLGAKSSASARKWVYTRIFDNVKDCYEILRKDGKKIYTTSLTENSISLYDLNLTEPVALVFGNEHSGISEDALRLADGNFLIPQVGMIQSLNISVACAVSVYEAFRQRLTAGMYEQSQLSEGQFNEFLKEWLNK
jgi:tRNA (guanosine-2'-O-)-methyltransferase